LQTTEKTSPDEWARRNRVYKASADRPGPRDPAFTPYVVPFLRAFDDTKYETLVFVCGSQMGKTDAILDVIGWNLDQRPSPMLYVGPSKDFLNLEIEPRIMDLLTGPKRLAERLATGKRMTRYRKLVGGVPLRLAWAGSASAIAAMAAKIALVDELDRMGADVKGEGDPFTLTEARGFSYRDRKRAAISTPLRGAVDCVLDELSGLEFWKPMPAEDVESPIWRLFQSGTMHHWAWPCPYCDDYFVPRFKTLVIPENASPGRAKREACIGCPRCGGVIEEAHKRVMNERGRFVAPGQTVAPDGTVSGQPADTNALTFWVSGLASPFVTIGERAAAYVEAKLSGSQEKLQGVINTGFGELFVPGGGDVPEWQQVAALKQSYARGELPKGVRILTCAVDVQKTRLYYVIRGWGVAATSWLVDYGELIGLTHEDDVWDELAQLITEPIGDLALRKVFVDSGFRPGRPDAVPMHKVYQFARRFPRLVSPTKGRATQDKPIRVSTIEVRDDGTTRPYGLDLVLLDTDHWKSTVHERVKWPLGAPGAWMLPADTDESYCKQIVSEARIKTPSGTPQWVARSRDNHYLDCEAMAAAAGWQIGVHRIRPRTDDDPPADRDDATQPHMSLVVRKAPTTPAPEIADQPAPAKAKSVTKHRPRLDPATVARMFRR